MSQLPKNPYRTLFVCTLQQLSSLSVGGTEDDSDADMPLCRDGLGRPVLRGTTLAGALIASLHSFTDMPASICRDMAHGHDEDDSADPPSTWDVWNAHLWNGTSFITRRGTTVRAGSAHRQDTRATQTAGLFSLEVLPPGLQWRFCIDVTCAAQQEPLEAHLAALGLREWQRERCWLGRRVARGLGWMKLVDCKVLVLPREDACVDAWPTNEPADLGKVFAWLDGPVRGLAAIPRLALDDYVHAIQQQGRAGTPSRKPDRAYVRWPLRIEVGPYEPAGKGKNYGLDALSVGGHGSERPAADAFGQAHVLRAQEQAWPQFVEKFVPDGSIATVPASQGGAQPVVPASGLAGAMRHWLSRMLRAGGTQVVDPVVGDDYTGAGEASDFSARAQRALDPAASLFGLLGQPAQGSELLLCDGHVVGDEWFVTLLEKVALDEFTQGAFESAKFDRLAVLHGCFDLTLVQEVALDAAVTDLQGHIQQHTLLTRQVLAAAAARRIGIGGGEFRAYGHVPVTANGCVEYAAAGDAWNPLPDVKEVAQ